MDLVHPAHHVLGEEFGLTVGVGGGEFCVFEDGGGFRLAVTGGGGAEDEAIVAGGLHGFEQGEGADGVVAEVNLWVFHALAGLDKCGEVEDAVEAAFRQGFFKERAVAEIAFNEGGAGGNGGGATMTEAVEDGDGMTFFKEGAAHGASDVARSSGDQNFHQESLSIGLYEDKFRRITAPVGLGMEPSDDRCNKSMSVLGAEFWDAKAVSHGLAAAT